MSSIEDKVCEKIQERSEVGKSKYGVTMERTDLNTVEWLTHLQEELMDATVYVERLLGDVRKSYEEISLVRRNLSIVRNALARGYPDIEEEIWKLIDTSE
jgi:hypothetical protein